MKILSCGAGMQSTALALMSCENKLHPDLHPLVPIYDVVVFCDLGEEPPWVYEQVEFIRKACDEVDIPFYVLQTNLYSDYMRDFGKKRVVSVPFWSVDENGKNGKMMRNCTMEYKIEAIQKFVRKEFLKYRSGQRMYDFDIKAHEMHIGFSTEEKHRCKDNPHPMFVNKFPLVDMELERKDNYKYILEVWGLDTKASACTICPFHRNFFYKYLKDNHPVDYVKAIELDQLLETGQPNTKIKSKLYISRSRKRLVDLTDTECEDKETFDYNGAPKWNGF